jgi:hypothetical protein
MENRRLHAAFHAGSNIIYAFAFALIVIHLWLAWVDLGWSGEGSGAFLMWEHYGSVMLIPILVLLYVRDTFALAALYFYVLMEYLLQVIHYKNIRAITTLGVDIFLLAALVLASLGFLARRYCRGQGA